MTKLLGALAVATLLFANCTHATETLIWKTEAAFVQTLKTTEECKADEEECMQVDHVGYAHVSHYGRTLYETTEEAHRIYVSFDAPLESDREVQAMFALMQLASGAVDWGGVMVEGKFKPLYAIKRFYDPGFDWSEDDVDQSKSGLYVWRLSEVPGKGRSVIIGMAGPQNTKARGMAEDDYAALLKSKK